LTQPRGGSADGHDWSRARRSSGSKTIPKPSVTYQNCVETIENSTTLSKINK